MPTWSEFRLVKPVLKARLQDLSTSFPEYVESFKRRGPFSKSQLGVHLEALRQRAGFPSAAEAVRNSEFADAVRDVLRHWGVGTRGAQLVSSEAFRAAFTNLASKLAGLEQAGIDDPALDAPSVASKVWDLISSVCLVTKNGQPVKNRLVSGTKALHHVLPKLIFPIDREYTQTFFGWHNPEFQNNPRDCFMVAFLALAGLAKTVKPARLVGEGWMSSPAKILDNAIVGYCVKRRLESENTRHEKKKRAQDKVVSRRAKEIQFSDSDGQSRKEMVIIPESRRGAHADRVRAFVIDAYIEPARANGQTEVRVRAGDVDKALEFGYRRLPLICAALRSQKFLGAARVRLLDESGPPSGASTTTTFSYELTSTSSASRA